MENKQLTIFDIFTHPFVSKIVNEFPSNESDDLEYKLAEGGFPDEFWKTYSAFANTNGGIIILGVKEKSNGLIFQGLDENKIGLLKKTFWDLVNNSQKVSANLLREQDVKVISFENKSFLAFKIPASTRQQRPIFLTLNPFDNTYKRNYEGDYKCTKEEIRRMLADADTNFHADSRIFLDYSFDDLDITSIKQYRQLFSNVHPEHPWLALDDKEFLLHIGAFGRDRKSKKDGPTLAGILLFGKSQSIIEKDCCPNFFPDFREILSPDPQIRWTDRIYPDGTWDANLFQFYRIVFPKLSSALPKPFQLKKNIRQDDTPAHTALREAFVNAIIHTDYSAPGNIVIEQRIDTFRFTNPGTLLVSLEQYYEGGISECRNTSLQKMFLMIGSAEKAGSGVNKIMSGWEYAHWRSPYLSIENHPDRLILELPMFSILPEETLLELRLIFGESIDALGKDELTILSACHIEGEISNHRLQFMLDLHKTDITKILQELCKENYLISENRSRWTTYHLNINFIQENSFNKDSSNKYSSNKDSSNKDSSNKDSSNKDSSIKDSSIKDSSIKDSSNKGSSYKDSSNKDSSNEDSSNEDSSIKERLKNEITKHVEKRLTYEILSKLVWETCLNSYKSLEEISNELKKSQKHLKDNILPKMINEGKLSKQFIDYHPNQKYKAIQNKLV